MKKVERWELVEALANLVAVTPEEYLVSGASRSARCHHCLASAGRRHAEDCPWIEAAALVAGDGSVRGRLVGEDEDDFEDRVEGDEEEEEEDEAPRARLRKDSADARREFAAALGMPIGDVADRVPPDLVEALLDDPLGDPEPFSPGTGEEPSK